MARVVLDHISKHFGSVAAVKDFHLTVEDKEFVILVGPSGCGKSTALRMVAGLEDSDSGTIRIGERDVTDLPPKDRDIAMVFQEYALYPHMTVYRNMAFGLKLRNFPKEEIDRRVREAAEILGIQELLDRKPKQLSGGQRQRVAVGRAIVRKPAVFLFDEPISNLDAKLRVQMRAELSKLHDRLQTTIIYVTHDQVEAMTMGSKIVVMKDGLIQQIGAPLEIYNRPLNLFVAGFIGSPVMNFIPCRLVSRDGTRVLVGGAVRVPLPEGRFAGSGLADGTELILGIRPSDVHERSSAPERLSGASFRAQVEVVEPLGSEIFITVAAGGQSLIARVPAENPVRVHQEVELVLDGSRLHLFAKEPPHERVGDP